VNFNKETSTPEAKHEMDRWARSRGTGRHGASGPTPDVQWCDGNMVIAAELPGSREHREDHKGCHPWERNHGHRASFPVAEKCRRIRDMRITEGR
jgi:hypothetical protein